MSRATPNRCVTLNIDTAARSGWAIWRADRCWRSGEVDVEQLADVKAICAMAIDYAASHGLPCVLVTERAYGGNLATALGMGGAAKIWRASWVQAGGHKSKRVAVFTSTWRSCVLGKGMGRARRDGARSVEQGLARALVGVEVGPDEAPAICMGKWSTYSSEVWKVLPKKFQVRA